MNNFLDNADLAHEAEQDRRATENTLVEEVYQEKKGELELVEEDKRARYLTKHCL